LQLHKIEARIEKLIAVLSEKTENMKSVFNIEDKVRQEMSKTKKKPMAFADGFKFGGGG
jgi:ATP-dependent Lon protease